MGGTAQPSSRLQNGSASDGNSKGYRGGSNSANNESFDSNFSVNSVNISNDNYDNTTSPPRQSKTDRRTDRRTSNTHSTHTDNTLSVIRQTGHGQQSNTRPAHPAYSTHNSDYYCYQVTECVVRPDVPLAHFVTVAQRLAEVRSSKIYFNFFRCIFFQSLFFAVNFFTIFYSIL